MLERCGLKVHFADIHILKSRYLKILDIFLFSNVEKRVIFTSVVLIPFPAWRWEKLQAFWCTLETCPRKNAVMLRLLSAHHSTVTFLVVYLYLFIVFVYNRCSTGEEVNKLHIKWTCSRVDTLPFR